MRELAGARLLTEKQQSSLGKMFLLRHSLNIKASCVWRSLMDSSAARKPDGMGNCPVQIYAIGSPFVQQRCAPTSVPPPLISTTNNEFVGLNEPRRCARGMVLRFLYQWRISYTKDRSLLRCSKMFYVRKGHSTLGYVRF